MTIYIAAEQQFRHTDKYYHYVMTVCDCQPLRKSCKHSCSLLPWPCWGTCLPDLCPPLCPPWCPPWCPAWCASADMKISGLLPRFSPLRCRLFFLFSQPRARPRELLRFFRLLLLCFSWARIFTTSWGIRSPRPNESRFDIPTHTGGKPWREKKRKTNFESRPLKFYIFSNSNFSNFGFTRPENCFE